MATPLHVMILEDQKADAELMLHELRRGGFAPDGICLETEADFLAHLKTGCPDVILSDYNMPQFDAIQALCLLKETGLDIPFIIVSGSIGEDLAVRAMRLGAADYLLKDRLGRLGQSVMQALENRRLREQERLAKETLRRAHDELELRVQERTAELQKEIAERMRFQKTLEQKTIELEKADQAKSQFLAAMSHELRTPLNAILGFTGTLLMKLPGPLNDDQEEQLRIVENSATHLLSLINDLLDLAKIESGKVELKPERVVCQGLIREVVTTLQPLARAKRLLLAARVPDEELIVRTDRRALAQILLNLTSNAIKFTERGWVHLDLDRRQVNGGALTSISVTDTGVGIRAEDQAKLFGAFEQVARGRQQGTGLGLHLSQKLATLLGGEICFRSKQGEGSTFTLLLKEN